MQSYTDLIKALRRCDMKQGCFNANCRYSVGKYFCDMDKVHKDAAAAIEDMAKHIAEMHERVTVLQIDRGHLETEVKELRRLNNENLLPKRRHPHWVSVEERFPEPNIQCLVRDDDNNCAVGYYRQDARAWDSPFFGWVERDDEYYEDGDLCRIGKVVAWMPLPEPPKEDA